jgi:hypothetical protein
MEKEQKKGIKYGGRDTIEWKIKERKGKKIKVRRGGSKRRK